MTEQLIPQLQAQGARFAAEDLEQCDNPQLASAIQRRLEALQKWQEVYREDFIPFAHGVRQLARYYNDALRPADPYEFVGLLKSQDMLASRRNRALARLAIRLRHNPALRDAVAEAVRRISAASATTSQGWRKPLLCVSGGKELLDELDALTAELMDITYKSERLPDRPDILLHTLVELAADPDRGFEPEQDGPDSAELERRLLESVGPSRHEEAREVLRIGRVSWRLRDDDNLLLSRVESQLFRAVDLALGRLRSAGRLYGKPSRSEEIVPPLVCALRDDTDLRLELPAREEEPQAEVTIPSQETLRQLTGQPAAPGLATGKARRVTCADDLKRFCTGEVLVCDAIQPMMTHLVPLAAGIVERRGGMLIHGAIIAREMQIPCVNGVAHAVDLLGDGDIVTVDGHLGIVTIGLPEFDLELASPDR